MSVGGEMSACTVTPSLPLSSITTFLTMSLNPHSHKINSKWHMGKTKTKAFIDAFFCHEA